MGFKLKPRLLDKLFSLDSLFYQIEDGQLSQWCYDRLQVISQSSFIVEAYIQFTSFLLYALKGTELHESVEEILLVSILICTVFQVWLSFIRTFSGYQFELSKVYIKPHVTIVQSALFKEFLSNLAILCIFPNYFLKDPKYHFETRYEDLDITFRVHINDFFSAIGTFKGLYYLTLAKYFSVYNKNSSHRVAIMVNIQNDTIFVFRCYFKKNPMLCVFSMYFLTICISSYLINVLEYDNTIYDFTSYSNCVWFSVVTMISLGYGDVFPHSTPGRI